MARPDADAATVRAAAEAAGAAAFIEDLDRGYDHRGRRAGRPPLGPASANGSRSARAFLRDPQILLLDEPTSALDPDSEAIVQEAIEHLLEGRTTLIIAHRLATARRAARIHVLDRGRLAAAGSHEELYAGNELYRRYWSLQSLRAPATGSGDAACDMHSC